MRVCEGRELAVLFPFFVPFGIGNGQNNYRTNRVCEFMPTPFQDGYENGVGVDGVDNNMTIAQIDR